MAGWNGCVCRDRLCQAAQRWLLPAPCSFCARFLSQAVSEAVSGRQAGLQGQDGRCGGSGLRSAPPPELEREMADPGPAFGFSPQEEARLGLAGHAKVLARPLP